MRRLKSVRRQDCLPHNAACPTNERRKKVGGCIKPIFKCNVWGLRNITALVTGSTPCFMLASWAVLASAVYAAGPVVLVVGPPGSGRSTQAAILKDLGMAVIAADEVISWKPRVPEEQESDAHGGGPAPGSRDERIR